MNKGFYDYSISAVGDDISEEKIIAAVQAAGLAEVQVEKTLNFDAFCEELPNGTVDGFAQRCVQKIDTWQNGGGEWPTADMLRTVCRDDEENVPQILAKKMLDSIAGVTCKKFEAPGIVVPIVLAAIKE